MPIPAVRRRHFQPVQQCFADSLAAIAWIDRQQIQMRRVIVNSASIQKPAIDWPSRATMTLKVAIPNHFRGARWRIAPRHVVLDCHS